MLNNGLNPAPEALAAMRERDRPGDTWHAYQNADLDSRMIGHTVYMVVGPSRTNVTAPKHAPDSPDWGLGWRYIHAGVVNLETGEVSNV